MIAYSEDATKPTFDGPVSPFPFVFFPFFLSFLSFLRLDLASVALWLLSPLSGSPRPLACHTRHQGSVFCVILRPLPRPRHIGTDGKDHFDPSKATKALTELQSTNSIA